MIVLSRFLNTKVPETLDNLPFLHIKRVHERDAKTLGGLKKSIRLCKNVKSDAKSDGKTINLPSFDIAAIMYHADLAALLTGAVYELGILAETQRYLDWATTNESEAVKLLVPDGSRPILDTRAKLDGLRTLSVEMDDLAREVAKEQGLSPVLGEPSLSEVVLSSIPPIYRADSIALSTPNIILMLGRVDGFDEDHGQSEGDNGAVVLSGLLAA